MALRTINNALTTLRTAKIILSREVTEKQPIETENPPIDPEKPSIGDGELHIDTRKPSIGNGKPSIGDGKLHIDTGKPSIGPEKPSIEYLALKCGLTRPTAENIHKLLCAFGSQVVFGRSMVMKETGLEITAAGVLINAMLKHRLIDTVVGHGKGKYRFRSTI